MSFISKPMTAGDRQKQNLDQLEPSFMYTILFGDRSICRHSIRRVFSLIDEDEGEGEGEGVRVRHGVKRVWVKARMGLTISS